MKKLLMMTALLFGATTISYASCENDVIQMYQQIHKYGSITSHDKHRFDDIVNPVAQGVNTCSASGYYFGEPICKIKWSVGSWGDTFRCDGDSK